MEEYTAAATRAGGGGAENFQKGISELAAKRGISDWEANPDTWKSVGRGLGKSELSDPEALAFARTWCDGDETRLGLVREAYGAAR